MANILVVDDELGIRELLFEILNDEGHAVELAENAAQARLLRERQRPDLVLLDIWMPDTDGVTLLKEWSAAGLLNMPVIMMSGHATIDTAVEATRIGAIAFLEKPITLQKLLQSVEQGLDKVLSRHPTPPANSDGHGGNGEGPRADLGEPLPVESAALPEPVPAQQFDFELPLREARDAFERAYFEFHLVQEHGSMTRVAEKSGLERTHLYRKLKQLGIDLSKTKRNGA